MAKKKVGGPLRVLAAGIEPEPEGTGAIEPEPEPATWARGTWKGLPQWRCLLCPWDTLDGEAAMVAHLAERHGPKKPRGFLIANRAGRAIE